MFGLALLYKSSSRRGLSPLLSSILIVVKASSVVSRTTHKSANLKMKDLDYNMQAKTLSFIIHYKRSGSLVAGKKRY